MTNQYRLGIDVGGTTVKFGLFTEEGEPLGTAVLESSRGIEPSLFFEQVAKKALQLMDEYNIHVEELLGVGVGMPGPVRAQRVVTTVVNLGWGEVDVVAALKPYLPVPIFVGNDANVAALGELWRGAGQGYQSLVLITLGTGVGGGIVIDGKIVEGFHGAGGEIGHMPILDEGVDKECGCGKHDCLELICSASGIIRRAKEKLIDEGRAEEARSIQEARTVFEMAKVGDRACQEIIEETAEVLGRACGIFSAIVDPEVLVIGGGVSNAGEALLSPLRAAYVRRAFQPTRETQIMRATLGSEAGIYGAAKLADGGRDEYCLETP